MTNCLQYRTYLKQNSGSMTNPIRFWDFSGSKPESVNNWYNVIAEDDQYTWSDFIADVGGQWGEECGAVDYVCPTDHNNPYAMLMLLKGKGILA